MHPEHAGYFLEAGADRSIFPRISASARNQSAQSSPCRQPRARKISYARPAICSWSTVDAGMGRFRLLRGAGFSGVSAFRGLPGLSMLLTPSSRRSRVNPPTDHRPSAGASRAGPSSSPCSRPPAWMQATPKHRRPGPATTAGIRGVHRPAWNRIMRSRASRCPVLDVFLRRPYAIKVSPSATRCQVAFGWRLRAWVSFTTPLPRIRGKTDPPLVPPPRFLGWTSAARRRVVAAAGTPRPPTPAAAS